MDCAWAVAQVLQIACAMPHGSSRLSERQTLLNMKILFVGWGLVKASGVTTFVEHVAEELRWLGHAVDVVDVQKQQQVPSLDGYDIAHFHCLWKLHAYAVAAKNVGLPAVYSTHGMTAPWSMKH